jgi:Family of unknown function (DUF5683)
MSLLVTTNAQDIEESTEKIDQTDSTFVMTKSPWGAVGRSALIPGWGQYYNESYWKIPVVWGVLGWFTYLYIENNNLYKDYKELYTKSLENGTGIEFYKNTRNTYRDERDKYALILGVSYLLNLVDAYVDAQLFDFNVIENPITHQPELGMSFRF